MKRGFAILAIGAIVAFGSTARAAGINFFFTDPTDPTDTPITNLQIGAPGSTFSLSVWFVTELAWSHAGANIFVGYDTSATAGLGATPLDNKIGLGDTSTTSHSNVNGLYSIFPPNTGIVNGGTDLLTDPTAVRPFGIEYLLPLNSGVDTPTVPGQAVRLLDVTLKNVGLADGETYTLYLYDAMQGSEGTSFLYNLNDEKLRADFSTALTVEAVPEPATLTALGLGVAALLRRRRR